MTNTIRCALSLFPRFFSLKSCSLVLKRRYLDPLNPHARLTAITDEHRMITQLSPHQTTLPFRMLRALRGGFDLRHAWHRTFHREEEQWTLIQFRDGADNFYHSRHAITCRRCGVSHTQNRMWPKFNADHNTGYELTEARRLAHTLEKPAGKNG